MKKKVVLLHGSSVALLIKKDNYQSLVEHFSTSKDDPWKIRFKDSTGSTIKFASNMSVLHFAAAHGSCKAAHYFMQCAIHEKKKKYILNKVDGKGRTPLRVAVDNGRVGVFSFLISKGAMAEESLDSCVDPIRKMQMECIVKYSNRGVFGALVRLDLNVLNKLLGGQKKFEIYNLLNELVSSKASVDKRNLFIQKIKQKELSPIIVGWNYIDTPLHIAVARRDSIIVQLFLDHGALVDAINEYGNTPLHLAIGMLPLKYDIYMGIITLLVQNGADSSIKNFNDQTPLDFARDSYKETLNKLFDEHKLKKLSATKKIENGFLEKQKIDEKQQEPEKIIKNTDQQGLDCENDNSSEKVIEDNQKNNDVSSGRSLWKNFVKIISSPKVIITAGIGIVALGYWFVSYYKKIQLLRFL